MGSQSTSHVQTHPHQGIGRCAGPSCASLTVRVILPTPIFPFHSSAPRLRSPPSALPRWGLNEILARCLGAKASKRERGQIRRSEFNIEQRKPEI